MRGSEILQQIDQRASGNEQFIRWWRRENDFADFELIDDFRERVDGSQEFEGYELLDLDEMWRQLQKIAAKRLKREKRTKNDVVIWRHTDKSGKEKEETCPYTARALMTIFDVETRGNPLV